jgi:hypothetical protein
VEKEALLTAIHGFLTPRKYFVIIDQGWSDWDLKVSRGLWARAELKVVGENHGGTKRLLRIRGALRLSRVASLALRSYAALVVLALLVGWTVPAAIVALVGVVNFGFIAYETLRLGRVLHRVIEIVASRLQLVSVADRPKA